MSITAPIPSPVPRPADAIRVMVVDDAIVVRGLLSRWIGEHADLKVVGALRTGREALDKFDELRPDVVVLDIEMPELDGLATLPLLLEKRRDLMVIMASALTRHHAEITLKALSLGAADYIPKPDSEGGLITSTSYRRELIEKIRALGLRRRELHGAPSARRTTAPPAKPGAPVAIAEPWQSRHAAAGKEIRLRAFSKVPPRVLLVGASTGGPQALTQLIGQLDGVIETAPVLITQHMPPTFTMILAEHLSRVSDRDVREAVDGEPVLAGTVYLAPGGRHMRVARRDGTAVIALDDSPPINFCRPSLDPLFMSAAEVWGGWNLALVLTGMGTDGTRGAAEIVAAGGSVIGQDEASSVVWGMPGSVAVAGLCSAVLPLEQIAPAASRLFAGGRP